MLQRKHVGRGKSIDMANKGSTTEIVPVKTEEKNDKNTGMRETSRLMSIKARNPRKKQ